MHRISRKGVTMDEMSEKEAWEMVAELGWTEKTDAASFTAGVMGRYTPARIGAMRVALHGPRNTLYSAVRHRRRAGPDVGFVDRRKVGVTRMLRVEVPIALLGFDNCADVGMKRLEPRPKALCRSQRLAKRAIIIDLRWERAEHRGGHHQDFACIDVVVRDRCRLCDVGVFRRLTAEDFFDDPASTFVKSDRCGVQSR